MTRTVSSETEEGTAATFPVVNGVRYSMAGDWCRIEADGTMTLRWDPGENDDVIIFSTRFLAPLATDDPNLLRLAVPRQDGS